MSRFEEWVESGYCGKEPRDGTENGETSSGQNAGPLEGEKDSYTSDDYVLSV